MADVNWREYECRICLAIGLTGAAVVAGLVTSMLVQAGLGVALSATLFLLVWGGTADVR